MEERKRLQQGNIYFAVEEENEMQRREAVNIRDPYILLHDGIYYLYGTRSATCWGEADGFDCYKSKDLEEWEGPIEIFHRPDGFFADRNYWAPECYFVNGNFYLVTTFGSGTEKKGIYILQSENPDGPFTIYSERLTPENWSCIDGTLYWEEGNPYLIFSHSFEDSPSGDMCLIPLDPSLKTAVGEPELLFAAEEAAWAHPVPFAKSEFGMDGDVYFTDGPCVFKAEADLYMLWSSWGTKGYAVGAARSETGMLRGPWIQQEVPVFLENGGHGMVFRDKKERLHFTLHYPNDKYKEHPEFRQIIIENRQVMLSDRREERENENSEME